MSLTPRLDLKQAQSLAMTPRLQQAIQLLQMTSLELETLVSQELESNPFLQKEGEGENFEERPEDFNQQIEDLLPSDKEENLSLFDSTGQEETSLDTNDIPTEDSFYEQVSEERNAEGDDSSFDFSVDSWSGIGAKGEFNADSSALDFYAAPQTTLFEALSSQINIAFKEPYKINLAYALLENLDENGFLPEAVLEKVPQEKIEEILPVLQSFSPTGIFSRSLKECFALQLKEKNRYDPAIACLLENLELLAKKEYKKLALLCGVDLEDIVDMIADIRALYTRPAEVYEAPPSSTLIPDVLLRQDKFGDFILELNQAVLPRVLINRSYVAEISSFSKKDKSAKKFLTQNLSSATFLIKALNQRAETILKVSTQIVENQKEFFKKGESFLKPMVLKDIADVIGMHESTISRVTAGKYIACSRGVFELKYFFSQAINTKTGQEATSAHAVKLRIKQMIENEEPQKVLSDESLVYLLKQEGIEIARRTVAKYRESMGILTSAQRKRDKRLKC